MALFQLYRRAAATLPRRLQASQCGALAAVIPNAATHVNSVIARSYLGDAGEMKSRRDLLSSDSIDSATAQREQELWDRAQPRYDAILERHMRLPKIDDSHRHADQNNKNNYNLASGSALVGDAGKTKEEMELDIRKKRLVYRSKQRGWLEVDLLLGTWANENVQSLSSAELDEFENFVNLETIDIYNIITLRTDVPDQMKSVMDPSDGDEATLAKRSVVERIQDWARASPLGKADKERYVEVKMKNNLI